MAIRFEVVFNGTLKEDVVDGYWDRTKYGELYYFSMINHFREEGLPPAERKFEHSAKQSSVEDCEILVFGDSFFEFSRHKQFPEKLADDFHKKVHFVNNDHPLDYLSSVGYRDTIPKLVLLERVERYLPVSFREEQVFPAEDAQNIDADSPLDYVFGKLFYKPSEELYDVMLKRSYLTTDLYSFFATLKFDLYGKISSLTPEYLVEDDTSWLFYHDQVNEERTSFYYQHTREQMDSIADHMMNLATVLQDTFNMQLVYLPIPAKYTLYHNLINDDAYNEFLPRLYRELDERNVKNISVYDDFARSDTLLYYRTDSHWNQAGIDIAYEKTLLYLRRDSLLKQFISIN